MHYTVKAIGYLIVILVMAASFSSCIVHKAGNTLAGYRNMPYGKYFDHSAGYGYVHARPPIN